MKILLHLLVVCIFLVEIGAHHKDQYKPFRTRAEHIRHAREHKGLSIDQFKKRICKGHMADDMERTAKFMQRMRDHAEKNKWEPLTEEEKKVAKEIDKLVADRVEMVASIDELNEDFAEHLFDGDIVLSASDIARMEKAMNEPGSRDKRAALYAGITLWPTNETIHYGYDPNGNYTQEDIDWFKQSLDDVSDKTCIKTQAKNEGFREVMFMRYGGCYAPIGYPGPNKTREISIGIGCGWTVQHEFHLLGMSHTQKRNDRDAFVKVNTDDAQFMKINVKDEFQLDPPVSYDFKSVMHYTAHAFDTLTNGSATIIPHETDYFTTMGSRMVPSFSDYKQLNLRYKCGNHCPQLVTCENGGYPKKCVCTDFYSGARCEKDDGTIVSAGQNKMIQNNGTYNADLYHKYGSSWDFKSYTYFKSVKVTGPVGKKLRVTLTKIHVRPDKCPGVCSYAYVEIIDNKASDLTMGGKLFCCDNQTSYSFTSNTNVIGYRGWAAPGFEYDFNSTSKCTIPLFLSCPLNAPRNQFATMERSRPEHGCIGTRENAEDPGDDCGDEFQWGQGRSKLCGSLQLGRV